LNIAFITFGVWRSSTQQKFLESQKIQIQERELILTIINSLPDAILSVNQTGEIALFNSSALSLLDTNSSLIGQNINQILKLKNLNGEKFNFREIFRKGQPFFSANNLVFENGTDKIRIELEILSIHGFYSSKQKTQKNFAVILRDITKQKTLDEERDEFISVVSHELRTPVAITEGAISNLQMMISQNSPQNLLEKNAGLAYKQVSFLATMVNDLSTLSRAERGVGDNFTKMCPKKLGEDLFVKYQKQVEEKNLALNLEISNKLQEINTSKLYIEELLQNIITNSIKYTKEGSITISIKPNSDATAARFEIRDTGIGISKSDQAKIFEKFYRSEDYRTRETGGTGLGLYISAKLAKKLGTEIQLKSRLNHGSTFAFEIPFAKK
jgi:PAS domain S-box-containing protein